MNVIQTNFCRNYMTIGNNNQKVIVKEIRLLNDSLTTFINSEGHIYCEWHGKKLDKLEGYVNILYLINGLYVPMSLEIVTKHNPYKNECLPDQKIKSDLDGMFKLPFIESEESILYVMWNELAGEAMDM